MKLNKKTIESLVYTLEPVTRPDGSVYRPQQIFWDDALPGFGIRIYPKKKSKNGKQKQSIKTFVLAYRHKGRAHIMTIGRFGVFTAEEARAEAKTQLQVVAKGGDPLADRQRRRKGKTVERLCADYIEKHAKLHKKTWRHDERRIDSRIIPAWGNLDAVSITFQDVEELHHKIGKTAPYEANRIVRLVSKIFNLAPTWDYVPENHRNPAKGIKHFKEEERDRWVTPEELPRLAEEIDKLPNLYIRAALWLYLLIGTRKNELLQAKWEHVDWRRAELLIPNPKQGKKHRVPLPAAAVEILRELPRAGK